MIRLLKEESLVGLKLVRNLGHIPYLLRKVKFYLLYLNIVPDLGINSELLICLVSSHDIMCTFLGE